MKIAAIVPAAGTGSRMKKRVLMKKPKQFWPLGKTTILGHVLIALDSDALVKEIIVAVSPQFKKELRQIIKELDIKTTVTITQGGRQRADSVEKALRKVSKGITHILVQDAVRPLLPPKTISAMAKKIKKADGIIVASPVAPTIKRVKGKRIIDTVDRSSLWEAETPQLFTSKSLMKAYSMYRKKKIKVCATDDAALVEATGGLVKVYSLAKNNFKITSDKEYALAQKIVGGCMGKIGVGYDTHRLVTGRELILGGVSIPYHKGCLGHSDGDPLLHAIIDALLGAAGLGDIGEHFPDTSSRYKNISSSVMLKKVRGILKRKGYEIGNIDSIVILERPNLKKYKEKMRAFIADLLDLNQEQISVKAKTKEGLDSEGSGFSVTAHAVVILEARQ